MTLLFLLQLFYNLYLGEGLQPLVLTKDVSNIHTGLEEGFRGWGQSDTSLVSPMYEVSKNVFGKAVLSLVAEFLN